MCVYSLIMCESQVPETGPTQKFTSYLQQQLVRSTNHYLGESHTVLSREACWKALEIFML